MWSITFKMSKVIALNRLCCVSGGQRSPWISGRSRVHALPGRPVGRSGSGPHHAEVIRAEERRGLVVLLVSRCEQPQPLQAAVQEPHEQHRADGDSEERLASGGRRRVRAQHPGERLLKLLPLERLKLLLWMSWSVCFPFLRSLTSCRTRWAARQRRKMKWDRDAHNTSRTQQRQQVKHCLFLYFCCMFRSAVI